ncbi:MAG TPA: hypothetical protein VGY54_18535 [Polyangiaceae bacterium]|jgi:hypothetical protein|nr:hypothetical protein [Polyangiaceae bacterium]
MKTVLAVVTVAISALLASGVYGCLVTRSTLSAKAADVEQLQCTDAKPSQSEMQVFQTMTVIRVDGQYSYHSSGVGKVVGTRIVVRPPEGISTERMTRILQCHGAQALLGHIDPSQVSNDPYWLPDAWVEIDVKSEAGNYVAFLTTDTVSDNLRIMRRATAFAAAHSSGAAHSALQTAEH